MDQLYFNSDLLKWGERYHPYLDQSFILFTIPEYSYRLFCQAKTQKYAALKIQKWWRSRQYPKFCYCLELLAKDKKLDKEICNRIKKMYFSNKMVDICENNPLKLPDISILYKEICISIPFIEADV